MRDAYHNSLQSLDIAIERTRRVHQSQRHALDEASTDPKTTNAAVSLLAEDVAATERLLGQLKDARESAADELAHAIALDADGDDDGGEMYGRDLDDDDQDELAA